jgi:hypothetical protein
MAGFATMGSNSYLGLTKRAFQGNILHFGLAAIRNNCHDEFGRRVKAIYYY